MHEVSIALDLQEILLDVVRTHRLSRVWTINIQFGELVQVVPDIFRSAFQEVCKGSIVEKAEINIEILPVKIRCVNCSSELQIPKEGRYLCAGCGSEEIEIIQGKEVLIKSIEGG